MQKFKQYEVMNAIVDNIGRLGLKDSSLKVLLQFARYYNPEKKHFFPKQSTIAEKTGLTERTIQRAVQELRQKNFILIEAKFVNHYAFTSLFFGLIGLSHNSRQESRILPDTGVVHEQIKENINNKPFRVLKNKTSYLEKPDNLEDEKQRAEINLKSYHKYNSKGKEYQIYELLERFDFKIENFPNLDFLARQNRQQAS